MRPVGDRIRELRVAQGLSQAELGERSGVNAVTISGIENGDNTTTETLQKLTTALDVSLAAFFCSPLADEDAAAIAARIEIRLRTHITRLARSLVDEVAEALMRHPR